MAEDVRERLIRYLQDAHAAEVGIDEALDGFIDDTDDPEIKSVFSEHRMLTKSQADRLEGRIRALGGNVSGGKSFMNTLMAKASDMIQSGHDDYDKNVQNLCKAYATEHLERAMYEALFCFANAIGDVETANLAKQIQGEEEATAQRLYPLIQQYAESASIRLRGSGAYPA